MEHLSKDEDATVAVMTTVGTVTSKRYVNTLNEQLQKLGYMWNVEVFQQGRLGIAEAVMNTQLISTMILLPLKTIIKARALMKIHRLTKR